MKSSVTIEDLLDRYRKKEELTKTNMVDCKMSGDKQGAENNPEIVQEPEILALQLKRYTHNDWKGAIPNTSKIEQWIAFSSKLNLKRIPSWGIKDTVQEYSLRGVIEHSGKTTKEGHYTAYVREGDYWTQWNDETSANISWEEVQAKQAYILIWEKIEEATGDNGWIADPITEEDLIRREKRVRWRHELSADMETPITKSETCDMEVDPKCKKRKRSDSVNLMREDKGRRVVINAEKRKKTSTKEDCTEQDNSQQAL